MEEKKGFFQKLKAGLSKTRSSWLSAVFDRPGKVDDEFLDELEEALILADMGMNTVTKLMTRFKACLADEHIKECDKAKRKLIEIIADAMRPDDDFKDDGGVIILIVGVNGVGKTTSIGKLASYYVSKGKKPLLAAGDTFRAAAAEQLSIWAQRAAVPIIKHGEGADPAAVIFDAIASYKARENDVLLCDTAGRLHNKKNLMNELSKIRRVIERELPDTHVEALIVVDATTGQNALAQARVFAEASGVTGVILTKLDGTAKGGVAVAVKDELGLPVRFIGVGEGINDLQPFNADEFASALLGEDA